MLYWLSEHWFIASCGIISIVAGILTLVVRLDKRYGEDRALGIIPLSKTEYGDHYYKVRFKLNGMNRTQIVSRRHFRSSERMWINCRLGYSGWHYIKNVA